MDFLWRHGRRAVVARALQCFGGERDRTHFCNSTGERSGALPVALRAHAGEGMKHVPEYLQHTLGSDIAFHYDSASGLLSVNVPASPQLPLTYTENWIGEPLRIMFGQLIYPRLVARNLPDAYQPEASARFLGRDGLVGAMVRRKCPD